MEIKLYREAELGREGRQLPAEIYNTAHALWARWPEEALFVPIRAMQYLAILDREEFVFVDSRFQNRVEIAWSRFRPQARDSLQEPVPYEVTFYQPNGRSVMPRLLGEFPKALKELVHKQQPQGVAEVIPFARRSA